MSNLKFKYLHKVDGDANNNKFYKMQENTDGTFTATYGREGAKGTIETYPMSKWESKLNEKLSSRKGYTDVTEHRTEETVRPTVKNSLGTNIISHDKYVTDIVSALQSYANQQTRDVYKAEAKGVTQRQIDDAQMYINQLSAMRKDDIGRSTWDVLKFDKLLEKLYTIIPRNMKIVRNFQLQGMLSATPALDLLTKTIDNLLAQEQSNLDSMAGQVIQNAAVAAADESSVDDKQTTLLEILGLEMLLVTDQKLYKELKDWAENNEQRKKVSRIFHVKNKATQERFDKKILNSKNKTIETLFHGSRAANWWFIVQQGLKIRPAGAVHSGSMWDDGVYFASDAGKSLGYTDHQRWTGNNNNVRHTYMALYDVHVGNQLIKTRHDSSCYTISKECKSKGYDSVWAKKGAGVVRDEYIVYDSDQSTIKYLIEYSA